MKAGLFVEQDFRYGRIRYLATDYGVGAMLAAYGEYFEGEVALLRSIVRPGDTVVSAGGNIGVHLIPLSKMVGSAGLIVTFEPQVFIREHLLEVNLELNGCDNVMVRPQALGADYGTASLPMIDYEMPNNFGGMELRAQGPQPVPVIPLDSLELNACRLIMLDVEGYEQAALEGARATIERHRPLLYVEIDREDAREPLLRYMHNELGYELLYHTPTVWNPKNFAGRSTSEHGETCSIMCLGVPG